MNTTPVNRATSCEMPVRPETPIESLMSQLGHAVNDLDELVGNTIDRLKPVIVSYPIAMAVQDATKSPKPMQCEHAEAIERVNEHVLAITERLRTAMANAQI